MKISNFLSTALLTTSIVTLSACVTPSAMIKMVESVADASVILDGIEKNAQYDINKKTCSTTDWENLGFENALKEKPRQVANLLSNYCPKKGLTFERAAYEAGYKKGLEKLCTTSLANQRKTSLQFFSRNSAPKGAKSPCMEIENYASVYRLSPEAKIAMEERHALYNEANDIAVDMNVLARKIEKMSASSATRKSEVAKYKGQVGYYNDLMGQISALTTSHDLPKTVVEQVKVITPASGRN